MALRALLFSKNPETADSLTTVLGETGIRPEICADIFAALDKGTKHTFPCIIVDWSDQPEARFLLTRARESQANRNAIAIAVVDGEPPQEEVRDNRIDFLIYRPISDDEARAVLTKARQQMQVQFAAFDPEVSKSSPHPQAENSSGEPEDPNLVSIAAELPESADGAYPAAPEPDDDQDGAREESGLIEEAPAKGKFPGRFRATCLALLLFLAVFCFWRERAAFGYLAHTPEGAFHVLKESAAALFYKSGAQSINSAMTDAQQDAYYSRPAAGNTKAKAQEIDVVSGEVALPDTARPSRKAVDLPLPVPEFQRAAPPPRAARARVPDSLRDSPPIATPVVVTVTPGQMMPVSTPAPRSLPQVSEPVLLSEEAARALLVQAVDPVYPPEALAQKLHGPVVLQAVIGRDGSVQDVKMVRGYFLLARVAVAAVKQWRFQPYNLNGHPAAIQTVFTVSFTYPKT